MADGMVIDTTSPNALILLDEVSYVTNFGMNQDPKRLDDLLLHR
jgi:hypothetical protein